MASILSGFSEILACLHCDPEILARTLRAGSLFPENELKMRKTLFPKGEGGVNPVARSVVWSPKLRLQEGGFRNTAGPGDGLFVGRSCAPHPSGLLARRLVVILNFFLPEGARADFLFSTPWRESRQRAPSGPESHSVPACLPSRAFLRKSLCTSLSLGQKRRNSPSLLGSPSSPQNLRDLRMTMARKNPRMPAPENPMRPRVLKEE